MAVVYASYSLRMEGDTIKENVVRAITYTRKCGAVSKWKLTVDEHVEDGKW